MKCPVCTTVNLVMSERQGIEIDYCPDCRGVWLDRGELDKIIERAVPREASVPPQAQPVPQQPQYAQPAPQQTQYAQQAPQQPQYAQQPNVYGSGHAPGHGHGYAHGQKPYRKKSFLEELFD